MPQAWTSKDYVVLMATGTSCLCLLVLVLGTTLGVLTGKISPEVIGTVQGASAGGGLLGFGIILYWIIKVSITGNQSNEE